jgi:hypothetical protein
MLHPYLPYQIIYLTPSAWVGIQKKVEPGKVVPNGAE